MLPSSSAQCLFVSDAGTGDIAALNMPAQTLVGTFQGSTNDNGTTNGIGMVVNQNYLYAGYTLSNTIATFSVGSGCQLSFLGDITVTPLNGGWIAGMALNGNMLVVTYIDGSIQSFNTASGIPTSNNDEQNATGFASAFFPDSVDITQDGHFAIFGDAAMPTTVEVSDLSSGKLAPTVMYILGTATNAIGPGVNSATVRLSPDESLLYIGNSQNAYVSAAFFNKNTGKVSAGCISPPLTNFYNPWSYVGVATDPRYHGNWQCTLRCGVRFLHRHCQRDFNRDDVHADRGCRVSGERRLQPGTAVHPGSSSAAVLATAPRAKVLGAGKFRSLGMRAMMKLIWLFLICAVAVTMASAQDMCPTRPLPGSLVVNPLDLYSQGGVLNVNMTLENQEGTDHFMHYCYSYIYQGQQIEAPTLRLNPGDQLVLNLTNSIQAPYEIRQVSQENGDEHACSGAGNQAAGSRLQRRNDPAQHHQHALPWNEHSAPLSSG